MRTLVHQTCLVIAMAVFLSGALAFTDSYHSSPPSTASLTFSREARQIGLGSATLRKTGKPVYTLPEREHTRHEGARGHAF